jgi:kynurenine formamidase
MFIELSYPIGPTSTVMDPGLRGPQVTARSRIAEGKSSNTSYIDLFAHTGTHIDVPWHFNQRGRQIMDFEIGEFVFSNVLLTDIPREADQAVERLALEPLGEKLAGADALLIRTGFGLLRASDPERYVHATPGLSVEAAQYLAGFAGLRCIGVDFISIENVGRARQIGYPVHHALLDRAAPMILLEDANLAALGNYSVQRLFLFPLRIEALEASPVTAVAEV